MVDRKITVLVADDEEDIREILAHRLRQAGFEVKEAADGSEAFQILTQRNVDAALCDLRMPKCDGSTLLKRARTMLGLRIPFAFISGDTTESVDDLLNLNSQAVFSKPFQVKSIVAWVQHATQAQSAEPAASQDLAEQTLANYCTVNLVNETTRVLTGERFACRLLIGNNGELTLKLGPKNLRNGQILFLENPQKDPSTASIVASMPQGSFVRVEQVTETKGEMIVLVTSEKNRQSAS
jgi:CheY-like chemotaxis protein